MKSASDKIKQHISGQPYTLFQNHPLLCFQCCLRNRTLTKRIATDSKRYVRRKSLIRITPGNISQEKQFIFYVITHPDLLAQINNVNSRIICEICAKLKICYDAANEEATSSYLTITTSIPS